MFFMFVHCSFVPSYLTRVIFFAKVVSSMLSTNKGIYISFEVKAITLFSSTSIIQLYCIQVDSSSLVYSKDLYLSLYILTLLRFQHSEKAPSPISSISLPKVTLFKFTHPSNALFPRYFT